MSAALACAGDLRSAVLARPEEPLNGIDFAEYRRDPAVTPGRQFVLDVTLLKPLDGAPLEAAQARVEGGVRIVDVQVLAVEADAGDPRLLRLFLSVEGDFSPYVLALDDDRLDPERAEARFGFKAGCPSDLDCAVDAACLEDPPDEPALDYLAKDYQSFRRLLIDLVSTRNPNWTERLPADLGVTLIELIAYAGDALSYAQDAAATEAWLDTCLHRVSAARHARLIDYSMHEGRNAWCFAQFDAAPGGDGVLPAGVALTTRIGLALRGEGAPPGPMLPTTADFDGDPALAGATVFETSAAVTVRARQNALRIHDWGDDRCCLPAGATEAWLYAIEDEVAAPPALVPGDYLLLEEVASPFTGAAADADPTHSHIVRLIACEGGEDPLFGAAIIDGTPERRTVGEPPLPLQRVRWATADALPRSLTLTAGDAAGRTVRPVSIARGNVVPADHGRTLVLDSETGALPLPAAGLGRWPLATLTLPDAAAPLTYAAMPARPAHDGDGRLLSERHDLARSPRGCGAALALLLDEEGDTEVWTPRPHLLESGPFDAHVVVEPGDGVGGRLRFGDGEHGRAPRAVSRARLRLRVGNGAAGNLGTDGLAHVALPAGVVGLPEITQVRQPLVARDGTAPETVAEVRALAPEAFRAVQERAVTEADWRTAALRHPGVAAARATFRWTGSWHTVFVAVHPRREADLVRLAGGGVALVPAFAADVEGWLGRFRIAGYDLSVQAAAYVPLEIVVRLCVAPGHRRGPVLAAARAALLGRGGPLDRLMLDFSAPVHLSRLYAALAIVPGIESATVTTFKRLWWPDGGSLARGRVALAPHEIARVADDPNEPEGGVLRIDAVGGL